MAIIPLVENPGAIFVPRAQVTIVDAEQRVLAGPLVVARRRAYHRQWLLGFAGITSRAVVEQWREQFVAIEQPDADG